MVVCTPYREEVTIGRTGVRYRVLSELGPGGMGIVYRAGDERLDRDVALKLLRPDALTDADARARLLREARLASRLNHPNVSTIYEVGESDEGQVYIAMELVEGETLSGHLSRGGLDAALFQRYGRQLADALAHGRSICRRRGS
jgi:serine/threonine-protein kinase